MAAKKKKPTKEKTAYDKLNPKQKSFYNNYIECMNAKKSYLAVYPTVKHTTAEVNGCRMLRSTKVKDALKEYFDYQWENKGDYIGTVLNKILTVLEFDITDFIDEKGDIDLIKARDCKNSFPIAEIRRSFSQGENSFSETKGIKSVDKLKAIDQLTKILGMIQEKVEHTGTIEIIPPKRPDLLKDNSE